MPSVTEAIVVDLVRDSAHPLERAQISDQFDAVIHFDHSRAAPLGTFPSGV